MGNATFLPTYGCTRPTSHDLYDHRRQGCTQDLLVSINAAFANSCRPALAQAASPLRLGHPHSAFRVVYRAFYGFTDLMGSTGQRGRGSRAPTNQIVAGSCRRENLGSPGATSRCGWQNKLVKSVKSGADKTYYRQFRKGELQL